MRISMTTDASVTARISTGNSKQSNLATNKHGRSHPRNRKVQIRFKKLRNSFAMVVAAHMEPKEFNVQETLLKKLCCSI